MLFKIKKKIKNRSWNVQLVIVVCMWLLVILVPVLAGDFEDKTNWDLIFKMWKEHALVFVMFLVNRFLLLPKLLFKGKRLFYALALALVFLCGSYTLYLVSSSNFKHFKEVRREIPQQGPPLEYREPPVFDGKSIMPPLHHEKDGHRNFAFPFANILILSILILGFDTGLVFSQKWIISEKNKALLEKENIENKMAFLQNQISPHFFMNTLNNIHALVDIDTEEAKESIIKLSRMMGYMLYESKTEKIPLQKEMDFIKSYIELMKIRFTDTVEIILDVPDKLPAVNIPPLLTISYIENAFKHGISYNENCFIRISFSFDKGRMVFDIINKIYEPKGNVGNSGVGVENTKNRLDLIYGNNYKLEIGKLPDENLFAVNLNVPL